MNLIYCFQLIVHRINYAILTPNQNCFPTTRINFFGVDFNLIFYRFRNDFSKLTGKGIAFSAHFCCCCCKSDVVKPQETSWVFMTSLTFFSCVCRCRRRRKSIQHIACVKLSWRKSYEMEWVKTAFCKHWRTLPNASFIVYNSVDTLCWQSQGFLCSDWIPNSLLSNHVSWNAVAENEKKNQANLSVPPLENSPLLLFIYFFIATFTEIDDQTYPKHCSVHVHNESVARQVDWE